MSAFSNYLEEKILRAVLNGQNFPPIPAVYMGLHLTSPTDENIGLEVDRDSYSRILVDFTEPDASVVTNLYNLNFPIATEGWGTITYFGIYDAPINGNLLFWGSFSDPVLIDAGDTLRIPSGVLAVTVD